MSTRSPSDNPEAHRELVVQSPPQQGRDVANLQRAIHDRLQTRGIVVPCPVHGMFTHSTWVAAVEAGYFLGLLSTTYLKTEHGRGVCTQGAQVIIRNPDRRSPEQMDHAKARQGQIERGPRYYEELSKNVATPSGKGAKAALEFAHHWLGTTESPANSNWGHPVQDWIRLAGYNGPVPWCGCFTNAAIVAAGVPSGAPWGIGFCPSVVQHAQAKTGGWSWHSEGEMGDIILFDEPGGAVADHQGLVLKRIGSGHYRTREGNTGASGGSQSNGGCVAEKDRVSSSGFRIVGFARPPYHA